MREQELDEEDLGPDPLPEVRRWYEEARAAGEPQPDAVALATATLDGTPSNRMVLMKSIGPAGLTFFSNYESAKGHDLLVNPRAAMVFFWSRPHRQIRVTGTVVRLDRRESEAYFRSRPYGAQVSAAASAQSRPVTRAELEAEVQRLRALHPLEVPLPAAWGGYELRPDTIEFWQGRDDRLHDRIRFQRSPSGWLRERLAP